MEDYRLSNGLAAANMLAEISQADHYANRYNVSRTPAAFFVLGLGVVKLTHCTVAETLPLKTTHDGM